ncbi:MAG: hypothetical protein RB292_00550 [Patescibacteria group bacterium]|jgi:hypothetical protein|nr:hypothetical protein [Patescibacteria group bacterium]
MKILINVALISILFLSGCATQTNLQSSTDGEVLGTEVEYNQTPESLESEPIAENQDEPKPTPQPQKTYVVPEPKPEPAIEPDPKPVPKPATVAQQNCHPSYSGCLKANASDYDCAGGSGNGPYYTGKVKVLGPDVFGLDRDNDGWGCE